MEFNQIFPTDIILEILSRLPAESVLECKSVCKTWKDLIQLPQFPQMHLTRLNHPDSTDSGKLRYVFLKEEEEEISDEDGDDDDIGSIKHLCYFEFSESEDWNHVEPRPRKIMLKFTLDAYIVLGSFNGLICVYGSQPYRPVAEGPAIILNPVTREYTVLPEFDRYNGTKWSKSKSVRRCHRACGFGYLAETNEYKVVRIFVEREEPGFVEAQVYTVGSGKGWRHVGRFRFGFRFRTYSDHAHGVFLNGFLHWKNAEGGAVVVFDLAEEKFRQHIPPPPLLTGTNVDEELVFGVSGGGILYYAVSQTFQGREYDDVWLYMKKNDNHVVKDHEGHHSWGWSKVASLEQREPFCFMEGGIALRYDQGNIKWFLSSTSTWENFVAVSEICRQVFPHKHTFVSLKQLGEVNAKIMEYG